MSILLCIPMRILLRVVGGYNKLEDRIFYLLKEILIFPSEVSQLTKCDFRIIIMNTLSKDYSINYQK